MVPRCVGAVDKIYAVQLCKSYRGAGPPDLGTFDGTQHDDAVRCE
jgi:hypothetical protein